MTQLKLESPPDIMRAVKLMRAGWRRLVTRKCKVDSKEAYEIRPIFQEHSDESRSIHFNTLRCPTAFTDLGDIWLAESINAGYSILDEPRSAGESLALVVVR